jgi:hypothetical protein
MSKSAASQLGKWAEDVGALPPPPTERYGWRVRPWAQAVGCSVSRTWELIAAGRIKSVKLGKARIIVTSPREFLATLPQD